MPIKLLLVTLLALPLLFACRLETDSPVVAAAAAGDFTTLEQYLGRGAEVNQADRNGTTPLIAAARHGQADVVRLLIARGANPNLHDGRVTGWNPLMHAIHKNQVAVVMALLEGGANINDRTAEGLTALTMAAGYGHTKTVEILLRHEADTTIETRGGVTALAAAVEGVPDIDCFTLGSCQTETVKAILRHYPNAPLGRAARRARWIARLARCSDVLRLVEQRGSRQRS